jgi:hypothetical protein
MELTANVLHYKAKCRHCGAALVDPRDDPIYVVALDAYFCRQACLRAEAKRPAGRLRGRGSVGGGRPKRTEAAERCGQCCHWIALATFCNDETQPTDVGFCQHDDGPEDERIAAAEACGYFVAHR